MSIVDVEAECSSTAIVRACRIKLDPSKPTLTDEEKSALLANIQLLRDAIVLFTATGAARGVSGHTGEHIGAYSQLG